MKKKLVTCVLAALCALACTLGATACGPDHIAYDMFGKTYKIGSTPTVTLRVNDEEISGDWEEWIKTNFSEIKTDGESFSTADEMIQQFKNRYNESTVVKNATVTISQPLSETENTRTGKATIVQNSVTTEIAFTAKKGEEYGDYNLVSYNREENPNPEKPYFQTLAILTSWDAKERGITVRYVDVNDTTRENERSIGFLKKDGTHCNLTAVFGLVK